MSKMTAEKFAQKYPLMLHRLAQKKWWLNGNGYLYAVDSLDAEYAGNIIGYIIRTIPTSLEEAAYYFAHPLSGYDHDLSKMFDTIIKDPVTYVVGTPLVTALSNTVKSHIEMYLDDKAISDVRAKFKSSELAGTVVVASPDLSVSGSGIYTTNSTSKALQIR